MEKPQQDFLRETARSLGLTQKGFAKRMGVSWKTFEKWLSPDGSSDAREMPAIAWNFVREISEHEALKKSCKK